MLKKSKVGSNAIKGTSKKLKIIASKKVKKLYKKNMFALLGKPGFEELRAQLLNK